MFKKIIPSSLAALALIAGLGAAVPTTATAGSRNLSLTLQGPHGSLTIGEQAHYRRDRGPRRYDDNRRYRDVCTPREAVYKAADFGVHRASVERVGNRLILVEGRKRGSRVTIGFIRNSRHCEVAFVDRARNNRSDRGFGYRNNRRDGFRR